MDTRTPTTAEAVAHLIDATIDSDGRVPPLAELARAVHVSPSHLRRLFVERIGVSPHAYADARRAERLRALLAGGIGVAEAIGEACFGSPSRVYERTDELLGMTPAKLRRGAPGERIRYALADSSLGRVVVATTPRGVCLVAFGESDDELTAEVRRRFPRASVEPSPLAEEMWVAAVVGLIDAPASEVTVPLDVRGTVFQRQVWAALREIPPGTTVTYSQLASVIGRPTATRAVAQACGSNPTAVVVPCHRVVGADGSLTGYRWGVARKKALLEREMGDAFGSR
ncbi:MAG TPA: methylated-DNA--[protein]-cysteine S-methyltransferase [Coriobacteriia bacterium]|jgi:AraC family transcriptional regulator of adaptative response/methylated-DNA-[protein]-cysteine methyltransferase